ncbi:DUF599 family protein [Siculibacillus lacustris]|uniref:DUF599 family protein n=1 Tax=Siculibacillus lacustris TaxID=1549641 RepID=A0A4Q9VGB9_9HYPH|nr:DUF599 family protein [Siculibacillus lacustris]TBW34050.1 DUF599 family protein [Siculibacillus lacustris]
MTDQLLLDLVACLWFVVAWHGVDPVVDRMRWGGPSLTMLMDAHRRRWMDVMRARNLRMVDTAIMASLQNGTAFFASSSLIALGGSFALLNQTDRMVEIFHDLPFHVASAKTVLEAKILGLAAIYAFAFFKFGWSYRLFNYSAILIGAVPEPDEADPAEMERATDRAADMQIDAGHHFHSGLRALFFSVGFFGWFVNAWVFLASTTFILGVLMRRQYLSRARAALLDEAAAKRPISRP